MKKEIECCDECETDEDDSELKRCSYCNKVFCLDCQEEHFESEHFSDFYHDHEDELWTEM